MRNEEKKKLEMIKAWSSKCIYRDKVSDELNKIIKSVSIYCGSKTGVYELCIEFDPISMLLEGEGWYWTSSDIDGDILFDLLECYIGKQADKWEDFNKMSKYEKEFYAYFDAKEERPRPEWLKVDLEIIRKQCLILQNNGYGFDFLPTLPNEVKWRVMPYFYRKENGLLAEGE